MSGLWSGIDELAGEDTEALDLATVGLDIVMIRMAIEQLEAQCLRRLARFDRDRGFEDDGAGATRPEKWNAPVSNTPAGS
jgi:hypothetical protein